MHVINKKSDNMIGQYLPEEVLEGREWISTDSPDVQRTNWNGRFILSYEDRAKERGEDWYYHPSKKENQPLYRYNDSGHRSQYNLKDLSDRKRIDGHGFGIAFGCSFTEGIGLATKDIYHQVLGEMMRMPVYNCGIGGCGNDVSFWNFNQVMRRYKPNFVVFQLSSSIRTMLTDWENPARETVWSHTMLNRGDFLCMTLAKGGDNKSKNAELELLLAMDETNLDIWRTIQIIESVKTSCEVTSTPLVFWDSFKEFNLTGNRTTHPTPGLADPKNVKEKPVMHPVSPGVSENMVRVNRIDTARDDCHPGPLTHILAAKKIHDKLLDNWNF